MSAAEKIAPTIEPKISSLNGFDTLYHELAQIFKHPWNIPISHVVDGLPRYIIAVHSPASDPFTYDKRVWAVFKEHMPPGYYDDGTCVMCGSNDDGSTDREYHVYPEKKS